MIRTVLLPFSAGSIRTACYGQRMQKPRAGRRFPARRWWLVVGGLVLIIVLMSVTRGSTRRVLSGAPTTVPSDFTFVGRMSPCFLELEPGEEALRVNCFQIDGELHIHSARYSKLPRFRGENWVVTVRRDPDVRVEIDGRIYTLRAAPIDDEAMRRQILYDRGYSVAWDGITVVRFLRREPTDRATAVN